MVEPDKEGKIVEYAKIEAFLKQYRSKDEVTAIFDDINSIMNSIEAPISWVNSFYDMKFSASSSYRHYEERSIAKFLYNKRDSENLYVEIETDKRSSGNNLFGLNSSFLEPVKFIPLVRDLPTTYSYLFNPIKEGLPRYELSCIFIYSDTYFYVFIASKQYVRKGWSESVEEAKTKYTSQRINYCDFTKDMWTVLIRSQIEKCISFIETSLERFVEQR